MSYLAAILLIHLNEYESYRCLINLTHSNHFLSFLRGDVREVFNKMLYFMKSNIYIKIEWRVNYFNDYFEKELPNLYQHFKALDLSTEMFLLYWFLSLFSA